MRTSSIPECRCKLEHVPIYFLSYRTIWERHISAGVMVFVLNGNIKLRYKDSILIIRSAFAEIRFADIPRWAHDEVSLIISFCYEFGSRFEGECI